AGLEESDGLVDALLLVRARGEAHGAVLRRIASACSLSPVDSSLEAARSMMPCSRLQRSTMAAMAPSPAVAAGAACILAVILARKSDPFPSQSLHRNSGMVKSVGWLLRPVPRHLVHFFDSLYSSTASSTVRPPM